LKYINQVGVRIDVMKPACRDQTLDDTDMLCAKLTKPT